MEEMLIHTVEQPAAPAQPETMPQPAPAEPTVLPKPPVPVRDRVLSFGLLILGYLVCRFQISEHPLLGLVLRVVKNVIEEAVALKAENDFTI